HHRVTCQNWVSPAFPRVELSPLHPAGEVPSILAPLEPLALPCAIASGPRTRHCLRCSLPASRPASPCALLPRVPPEASEADVHSLVPIGGPSHQRYPRR